MKNKQSLLSSGIKLSFFTLISRILGLIRETTKASFLGTSALADAFTVAFLIPNLFRRLFAENSISVAFIPTFKSYLEENKTNINGKAETQQFISATFTLVSFFTSIVVVLGIIITPLIVPFFTNHTDTQTLNEMAILTRIMFPYLFVISLAAFFQGILNGVKIFSPSGFTPILFNTIVIATTYILSPHMQNPARAMSTGVVIGGSVQALFQLPFVLKQGFKITLTNLKTTFKNPGTRRVLKLIGPTIIGMAAYQLNDVISTAIAGYAGTGIQSSLQYSLRLQELILGIFAVTIGTVILPDLSGLAKQKKWNDFTIMLTQAMKIIALITIPVTFYSLTTSSHIITIVYKSNSFTSESVRLTQDAFVFHIAGLFFIALNRIIAPSFYAQNDPKSPTAAGIIGFAINILLAIILVTPLKGGGIALSLTIASFANTILLFMFLNKSKTINVAEVIKPVILYALKIILFSIVAVIPIVLLRQKLFSLFEGYNRFIREGIPLSISAFLFAIIGVFLLVITKDSVLFSVKNRFIKRNKGKTNVN